MSGWKSVGDGWINLDRIAAILPDKEKNVWSVISHTGHVIVVINENEYDRVNLSLWDTYGEDA